LSGLQHQTSGRTVSGATADAAFDARIAWVLDRIRIIKDERERRDLVTALINPVRPTVVGFVNAHAVNLTWEDPGKRAAFEACDFLLRDGVGLQWFFTLNGREPGLNMNGTDLIPEILTAAKGRSVALFGTRDEFVTGAADVLRSRGIHIVATRDGFQPVHSYVEAAKCIRPDIIVLAMGMPKQEIVATELKKALAHPCLILNGGAICDFLSKRVPRAPEWMRKAGIEWLFRLSREPQRLFKRYVIGNPLFLMRVLSTRVTSKF
jgi:exopolysaccharide biosynthesis WecB/TagA/CpsF family protein